ncbi:alpha/beta fold hydrolase [Leucothrix arctica]|uniref:Proline iminopeptidase n=1 Tax=Leucothrix arctica TaxID=1481894 RepID=A0A317CCR5_9GAMM|nr:alpha/beta fold hydrolase [Leucothrix arctica]PWQ95911.1 hypothetical protein DKT75_11050 [Leucothrix arctica]
MKRGRIYLSLLVCGLFLATFYWKSLSLKPATLPNGAAFTPSECWFKQPESIRMQCGYFHTRSPSTEIPSFKLPIVVLRHSWWQNSKSPMLHLAGGPGGSAYLDSESILFQIENFIYQKWGVDFVLYDQRGTGLSEPALNCEGLTSKREKSLALPQSVSEESAEFLTDTQACLNDLKGDEKYRQYLKYISTDNSVQDIADLHDLLAIDQWVLMGTSYGTRLALESARQIPSKIKSMVLDSVYPPEVNGFETLAENDLNALQVVLKFCKSDQVCHTQYPDLENKMMAAFLTLKQKALNLEVPQSSDKLPNRKLALTADRFLTLLSYASYDSTLIGYIPATISAVVSNDSEDESLIELAANLLYMQLSDDFSDPVFMITECLENNDFDIEQLARRLVEYQAQYPVLDLTMSRYYEPAQCEGWIELPTVSPRDYRARVKSDIPSLLLAGALDSVTPPRWAISAEEGLTNSTYLEYPDAGHAVLYSDLCSNDEVKRFLNPEEKETIFCDNSERLSARSTADVTWAY